MKVVDRLDFVPRKCAGKRVLDLGCIGSYAYDQNTTREILWLHDEIKRYASKVVGYDIDTARAERLRQMGYDIHVANVYDLPKLLDGERFDVVVAGELIEHLPNPGQFLDIVASLLAPGGEIVLTTPNPGHYMNLFFLFQHRLIASHTDHVAWFDMETIKCLAEKQGLRLREVRHYRHHRLSKLAWLRSTLEKGIFAFQPRYAPGLIAVLGKA